MNLFIKILLIIFFFAVSSTVKAQTFAIPDPQFKLYLTENYPWLFDSNNELVIESAKNWYGTISCPGRGIKDLSGIQYFHNIYMINCTDNQLTSLPHLDSLKRIKNLWANDNQLVTLPPLKNLDSLQILDVKNNELKSLPDLSTLKFLEYLDCSNNKIQDLSEISVLKNLKTIYCYKNQLSNLPSLKNLEKLEILDCNRNTLKSLPDLTSNTSLKTLKSSYNYISNLPDLSGLNELQKLIINNNLLSHLPDLKNCTKLDTLIITHNQLTFEDLIPVLSHPKYSNGFALTPQDTIILNKNFLVKENQSFELSVYTDSSIGSNTYKWYNNKKKVGSTNENRYFIESSNFKHQGQYLCQITNANPEFNNSSIWVKVGNLTIQPCFSISSLNYRIISSDCQDGISIEINDNGFYTSPPVTYELTSKTGQQVDKRTSTVTVFHGLASGRYDLKLKDSDNCEVVVSDFINLPPPGNCEKTFTPNGDGVEDEFYIQAPGATKIYNKQGKLIKELVTPASWDGTDQYGSSVPMGFYIIVIEEKERIGVVVLN